MAAKHAFLTRNCIYPISINVICFLPASIDMVMTFCVHKLLLLSYYISTSNQVELLLNLEQLSYHTISHL